MTIVELIDRLRYKGEGPDLDFKRDQYKFNLGNDHQKSELLKDILAIANSYRDGPGYILIGFKDNPPYPAEIVGISDSDRIDDAALQQFVNSKVQPKLDFRYETVLIEGKTVAVVTIPRQKRPFYLTKDYGKLKRSIAYVRRGSSTDEASLSEVSTMGHEDTVGRQALITLLIEDNKNRRLPTGIALRFLKYDEDELPDYEYNITMDHGDGRITTFPPPFPTNRDYWRDGARYHSVMQRAIFVRLALSNESEFPLSDAKLEVSCLESDSNSSEMIRAADLPDEPESSWHVYGIAPVSSILSDERMRVDCRGHESICHIRIGTLLPGEVGRAEDDLVMLPEGPGIYKIRVRILAGEINPPIVEEHLIEVTGPIVDVDFATLKQIMHAALYKGSLE